MSLFFMRNTFSKENRKIIPKKPKSYVGRSVLQLLYKLFYYFDITFKHTK